MNIIKTNCGDQGEIYFEPIDAIPDCQTKIAEKVAKGAIISHSESGHHHILTGDCEVLERTSDVPEGMAILYAILKEPQMLIQDAAKPHDAYELPAGIYQFTIAREWNSFTQQARRVAD
jgi:uncharacterized phosphosugar-binding protein